MRQIILYDTMESHSDMLPLSYTRPIAEFRMGIRKLREVWEEILPGDYSLCPVNFQRDKFGSCPEEVADALFVSGALLPEDVSARLVEALQPGEALRKDGVVIAYRGSKEDFDNSHFNEIKDIDGEDVVVLKFVYDVFLNNSRMLTADFARLTRGRKSAPLPENNLVLGSRYDSEGNDMIFLEEGAQVEGATLNVKDGPIYIGKDAVVMEGVCVRGPLALCEKAQVKVGAKICGGTTFGPYCKVGGEVQNTVIFGYSNKAHDGYLGNAVIGEWCNIGAGVNASNLKNDYSKIRIWNYPRHTFMRTDLQFCGLIMGDHSKAGINCMFNTATVVGVGVNLHGAGFPRVFVPSFQEGSPAGGMTDVPLRKFYQIAERVMSRRGLALTESDFRIYERVYEVASAYKH